ncbi:hypothetical protein Mx8p07 [Myxococcus phage Mx8]|uniref:p7 n=1 Tax=Myxococcus phage Mx8 TaxID=49964 RepID=O03958_9CAUD|nr:hypothetical protein Mx8p07 [Myxococcus phage Mx8]AAC48908.1 unknown [Myxococcus phage Mx8]AAK94342.1 p7 [Myxococcus phage Mx8]
MPSGDSLAVPRCCREEPMMLKRTTIAAYVGKDLYGAPVWMPLVQEDQDGVKRAVVSSSAQWEPLPAGRTDDAQTVHAKAVELFGPPPESPAKPLPRKARLEAMLDLERRVEEWALADFRAHSQK